MPLNLKDLLSTSSTERKGIIVLLSILILLIAFFFVSDYFFVGKAVDISVTELKQEKVILNKQKNARTKLKKEETKLFQFNPNTITKNEWQQLGFSEKQAKSIINFRESGFIFKQKKDLKKLFVVDDDKYKQLLPYIVIPKKKIKIETTCYRILLVDSKSPVYDGLENLGQVYYKREGENYKYYSTSYSNWESANSYLSSIESKGFEGAFIIKLPCNFNCFPIRKKEINPTSKKIERKTVELNSADSTLLKSLKGVGSYYAKKIIEYRTKLGGFYSLSQLKEVYGLNPEVLEQNKGYITLDTLLINKININKVSVEELKKHPYIKWRVANSIVMYRANHGAYKSNKDIQQSDLVTNELYRKIAKYLTVKE